MGIQKRLRGVEREDLEAIRTATSSKRIPDKPRMLERIAGSGSPPIENKRTPLERHINSEISTALKDFREIFDKEQLKVILGEKSGKAPRQRAFGCTAMAILDTDNMNRFAESILIDAFRSLEIEKPLSAFERFIEVADAYLNDSEGKISHEIGSAALIYTKKLSRIWAVAAAAEYLGLDYSKFLPWFKSNKMRVTDGEIAWPWHAIRGLGLTGELKDLITIKIIADNCRESSTEREATDSSNYIRIIAVIRFGLRNLEPAARTELGLDNTIKSEMQLIHILKFLFNELGISRILSLLPSMKKFESCNYKVYYSSDGTTYNYEFETLRRLTTEKLSQKLKLDGDENAGYISAKNMRAFLLQYGLVVKMNGENGFDYQLTEKGEKLIKAILHEVGKEEFGIEQQKITQRLLIPEKT